MMKNILITGGSGLIGQHLTTRLIEKGYQVAWLSRNASTDASVQKFEWNIDKAYIDPKAFDFADAIVHLAGAGIADKPWSEKRKKEIVDSRVKSTALILNQLHGRKKQPQAVVAASAVGYYGAINSDHIFVESDPPSTDFLGTTTLLWEKATQAFRDRGIPTVQLRLGVVLAHDGGALSKMALPVKYGLGAPLGTGKQIVPWIHIVDLCNLFIQALEQKIPDGVYNAVAPAQDTNREFMKTLSKIMKRPYFLPAVPGFLLRLVMGQMSDMVLKGSSVSAQKVIAAGFQFSFPKLSKALEDILIP